MAKVVMRFGEVVLRTSQYDTLKSWYSQVLDAGPIFESKRNAASGPRSMRQMCVFRPYSEYSFTESLVVLSVPGLREPDDAMSGMDHFQMRFESISDLFDRYEALAAHGIL